METKRCVTCTETKTVDNFGKNRAKKDGLQQSCYECRREVNAKHYKVSKGYQNPKRYATKKRSKEKIQKIIWEWLIGHPCVDCGETDPIVLQFDHVRGKKVKDLSVVVGSGWSEAKTLEEIYKCDVRCANCHTRKTAKQLGWWKLTYN